MYSKVQSHIVCFLCLMACLCLLRVPAECTTRRLAFSSAIHDTARQSNHCTVRHNFLAVMPAPYASGMTNDQMPHNSGQKRTRVMLNLALMNNKERLILLCRACWMRYIRFMAAVDQGLLCWHTCWMWVFLSCSHAGYTYCGSCAAYAYKQVDPSVTWVLPGFYYASCS